MFNNLRKRRQGVSTVLGVLIFIGILFTAVIPMQLVMKEADTVYVKKVEEMERRDGEVVLENVYMWAYPTTNTSDQIKVRCENQGTVPVKLVRVWIMNNYTSLDENFDIGQVKVLGPFEVSLMDNYSYPVTVTSARGRSYSSLSGNLFYGSGVWWTPSLGISVNVANDKGKYHIKVSNSTWSDEYWTQGMDFGDLVRFFEVKEKGMYNVECEKNVGGVYVDLAGTPMMVEIIWPGGSPIVYVYTSGIGI